MRRTGDGSPEDPVKGWESAADAGFRAAEAATREPVTDKRTAAGLPKRVPGKNRVPGAVAAQTPQARGQGAQAPGQAAAPQRQAQGRQGGPAPQQPRASRPISYAIVSRACSAASTGVAPRPAVEA
ncbi:hypothetical protein GEV43_30415 [Actinomadura sp. J1-007]|nr:hypothetical protein [Actinomadura sp. J1-007]MWK37939.1 hypothetical protein [Actinomadura sp. J1-007]